MTHCVLFSAVTMQWSAVEAKGDIPEPLSGHSATLFGSQIFVFGGYDGQTYHDQLYVFDTRALTLLSAQWNWDRSSMADPFPLQRRWSGASRTRLATSRLLGPGTRPTRSAPRYSSSEELARALTTTSTSSTRAL